jgi:hypothetical protein
MTGVMPSIDSRPLAAFGFAPNSGADARFAFNPLIKQSNSSRSFRLSLVQRLAACYIKSMEAFDIDGLSADLAPELERRYFWWEPVGTQPRSHARILALAMNLASFGAAP